MKCGNMIWFISTMVNASKCSSKTRYDAYKQDHWQCCLNTLRVDWFNAICGCGYMNIVVEFEKWFIDLSTTMLMLYDFFYLYWNQIMLTTLSFQSQHVDVLFPCVGVEHTFFICTWGPLTSKGLLFSSTKTIVMFILNFR